MILSLYWFPQYKSYYTVLHLQEQIQFRSQQKYVVALHLHPRTTKDNLRLLQHTKLDSMTALRQSNYNLMRCENNNLISPNGCMLKMLKTKWPSQRLNPRCVKLVGKCTLSHDGELGSFRDRKTHLALSLHEIKDKYDSQHTTRMEESRNAYRITVRKASGKRSNGISRDKGNTKMHEGELGSDTAGCMVMTHDRVI